ncbi:MAG: hypothetical protein ABF468_08325 [Acetobacter fabarum]|uniref:hypothetical protein n=1 Tax=Acetobacter fabarum TaxID=483199 RepID=UPI0039EA4409
MTAFTRLWHRAPLWRTALITAGVCGTLSVLFPAPWLASSVPGYGALSSRIRHMLPSSLGGTEASDALHPDEDQRTVSIPPMDAQFEGSVVFAVRQLPLPAGKWHPVVNFQDDVAHGEVLTTLYVRSAQGIVTGLIIAQATTQSLPIAAMSMIEAQCHSSFNFMNEAAPQDGNRSECWMTTPIRVVNNLFLTSNEPLQTLLSDQMYIPPAVQRLTIMGFDLPPILVDAGWNLVEKSKSGTGVDFMSVHTLLSPAEAGARRVPGAPENWSRAGMSDSAAVTDFVQRTNTWLRGWVPTLLRGFENKLPQNAPPSTEAIDPAFHG